MHVILTTTRLIGTVPTTSGCTLPINRLVVNMSVHSITTIVYYNIYIIYIYIYTIYITYYNIHNICIFPSLSFTLIHSPSANRLIVIRNL